MNIWIAVRTIIILAAVIGSLFTPLGPQAQPPIEWDILWVFAVFCPMGLLFIIGLQYLNPKSAPIWSRPSWRENPFNFRNPLQFFHLGAYVFVAQGIVTLLRVMASSVKIYPEVFVFIIIGLSTIVGLKLCVILFKGKFCASAGA